MIAYIDEDGIDRTPKPLDPSIFNFLKKSPLTDTPRAATDLDAKSPQTILRNERTNLFLNSSDSEDESSFNETPEDLDLGSEVTKSDAVLEPEDSKVPTHMSLVLNETETIYLLTIANSTEFADGEEAGNVLEDNDRYDYLTVGKGRNRRTVSVGCQTVSVLMKKRETDCDKIEKRDAETFTSNWEMFDTFNEEERDRQADEEDSDDEVLVSKQEVEAEAERIMCSDEFQDAVTIIERLLANNVFIEKQKTFRDIESKIYTDDEVQYRYTLEVLLSFIDKNSKDKPVKSMEWNPFNKDLLAVAHGKFFSTDETSGLVNIWNIKNPVLPERSYQFQHPVTSLSFSKINPYVLGISLYCGKVYLIDISKRKLHIIAESVDFDVAVMDVPRQIQFMEPRSIKNLTGEDECMVIYESGRVLLFKTTRTQHLEYQQIMRTPKAEGKIKGLQLLKNPKGQPSVCKFVAATSMCQSPSDADLYYVTTDDGVVHICSRNFFNHQIDLFQAHEGPITYIGVHPFCDRFLITCGSDMYTRFWAEGVDEPIFEIENSFIPMVSCQFSPTHPTLFALIGLTNVYLWDMQRKSMKHQSTTELITKATCTSMHFRQNGKCLIVGDTKGQVHVYSLRDIPYPPFFPENLFMTMLRQQLLYKDEVISKLEKRVERTIIVDKVRELKPYKRLPEDDEEKRKSIETEADENVDEGDNNNLK